MDRIATRHLVQQPAICRPAVAKGLGAVKSTGKRARTLASSWTPCSAFCCVVAFSSSCSSFSAFSASVSSGFSFRDLAASCSRLSVPRSAVPDASSASCAGAEPSASAACGWCASAGSAVESPAGLEAPSRAKRCCSSRIRRSLIGTYSSLQKRQQQHEARQDGWGRGKGKGAARQERRHDTSGFQDLLLVSVVFASVEASHVGLRLSPIPLDAHCRRERPTALSSGDHTCAGDATPRAAPLSN